MIELMIPCDGAAPYGDLVIASGPSGCGKDTVIRRAMEMLEGRRSMRTGIVVSCTTRGPRENLKNYVEKHGVDYFFMSDREFEDTVRAGRFLEYNGVHGDRYGTPLDEIDRLRSEGCEHIFLNIDPNGMRDVTKRYADIPTVFILPPSMHEQLRRLIARATDPIDVIYRRVDDAKRQIPCAHDYDYVIMNDKLEEAANELAAIVEAVHEKRVSGAPVPENVAACAASLHSDMIDGVLKTYYE